MGNQGLVFMPPSGHTCHFYPSESLLAHRAKGGAISQDVFFALKSHLNLLINTIFLTLHKDSSQSQLILCQKLEMLDK